MKMRAMEILALIQFSPDPVLYLPVKKMFHFGTSPR